LNRDASIKSYRTTIEKGGDTISYLQWSNLRNLLWKMSQEKLSFLLSQNHNHCLLVLSVYVTLLCLFVCMSVCVFVCLSVCLTVYLSFKLSLFDFIIIIQVVFSSEEIKPFYTGTSKNAFSVCISFFLSNYLHHFTPSVYFYICLFLL